MQTIGINGRVIIFGFLASLAGGCTEPGEESWYVTLSGRFAPTQLPMCEPITSTLELVAGVDDSGLVFALSPANTARYVDHEMTVDAEGDIDFEMSTGELSAMREDWDLTLFRGDGYFAGNAILTLFDDRNATRCKSGYNVSQDVTR